VNETVTETESSMKVGSSIQHSNANCIPTVGSHTNSFGESSSSWGTPFFSNMTQKSQSYETVTKHGNETEVVSEDKLCSWGTPCLINTGNTAYPSNRNSQRFFSSHQSSLHSDQLQWKSNEYSWKSASYLGTDMQKPCPNALPSYAKKSSS